MARLCAALLCLLILANAASAKDLAMLAKILSSPFLVQQGIAICSTGDILFSPEEASTLSSANSHANELKMKVSEGLNPQEIEVVLRGAADNARGYMTEVIRLLKSNPPDIEQSKRIKWCKENLITLANKALATYQNNKEKFEDILEKAKRD